MQTILVVDDEEKICSMIALYLEAQGFKVIKAYNGLDALVVFKTAKVDCIILDINMPQIDGLLVAKEIRKISSVPILFLSAKTSENDKISGLDLGADDYITKPFSLRELTARINAVLRRSTYVLETKNDLIRIRNITLDKVRREVQVDNHKCTLTSIQFDILAFLMSESGRVKTRLDILQNCLGSSSEIYDRTIDAHIKNIRKALNDDSDNPVYIETIRGVGYKFKDELIAT